MNAPQTIASPVEGVTVLERTFKSKANSEQVTQRLYRCPNGWSLGARRGGALHMAGECEAHPDGAGTWEIFTLTPHATLCGESIGWVTEEQIERAVARLATWFEEPAA